ncbi:hypothetical protein BV25DRAFT_1590516 [Artomyces pyxidatus]|uniref:Uncharacterized protein n=1 Tax=Artomyces pyxidatus TaxID=48021 RepID=A0ACB8TCR9_9AGAM|nr:hypothetical protein BV25DRAFT_1590516 [Artomyces pyxidatus]
MGEPVSKALITSVVDALLQCPKLTSVEWNCLINEDTLPIIMRLNMLRDFSVQRLTTIAYFRLDRFLMSMPHLEGLHLHTFGAMHIQELAESHRLDRLKRLTLGKSSLLLRPQVMFLLSRTTHLERLDIYYYSFLFDAWTVERAEPEFTGLARLRDLTIRHGRLEDEQEFADVVSWIATLSGATQLQSLTIHSVYGVFAFSAALANMIAKHSSLRSFFATHILLSSQDFLSILRSCSLLEDASFLMEKGDFEYLLALAKDPASSAFRGKLSITDYCDVLTVAWHKDIVV